MLPVPPILMHWLAPFAAFFTKPTWDRVLVLATGAVLAPGRRTVTAVLSVLGRRDGTDFARFHGVLNRARWSGRSLARTLLRWLVAVFVPEGPVVVGIDETIERRWGPRISARGIYRDPVRSSKGHFVKASGLRWVSVMLMAPIPWAGRIWGLPFLAALAPSERHAQQTGRRHKPLTDWGRQMLLLVSRWLPGRRLIAVADTTYAVIDLLAALRHRLTMVTRLRLDARLFDPPPPHRPGTRGRRRVTGQRQPTLVQRLADPASRWRRVTISQWYGESRRELDILTGTAVWDHPGRRVPVRWVLVRDVVGEHDPQAFLCTDQQADALDVLRWFVRRWAVEVTFEEVRRHLGVETQRQWSDKAIARTTPALLALFSLVTLWAHDLVGKGRLNPRSAAWYPKRHLTFSDALGAVRRQLWEDGLFQTSSQSRDMVKIPAPLAQRLLDAACFLA
jgi:hypothetical protein